MIRFTNDFKWWLLAVAVAVPSLLLGACGDDAGPGAPDGAMPGDAAAPPVEGLALVRGTLFTDDVGAAGDRHDAIASGGREAAMTAGSIGHDPFLGTALLGSTPNAFLSVDRWSDGSIMAGFYSDPAFAEPFSTLFDAEPSVELFERHSEFHEWNDLDAADGSDRRLFVVVRGRLALSSVEENQGAHDAVASAGEEMVRAAGDVAHVVYLRQDDPREFLAIDVWTDDANIEAVYGNPDFRAAFGTLFEGDPNLGVYESTSWEQW